MSEVKPPVILRTSERSQFGRCPQAWWWSYREGWRSNQPPRNPLWFGSGIHECLAAYYIPGRKRGPHPAETWEKWAEGEVRYFKDTWGGERDFDESEYVNMVDLGREMLEAYVLEYKGDESWEVVKAEISTSVSIPRNYYPGSFATYGFTVDGVYRDLADGKLKLMEHKTASSISTRHLSMDPQRVFYSLAATTALRADGIIGPKDVISEMTYNFLRKGKPDDRPRNEDGHYLNKDGSVSKKQPPPLFLRHTEKTTKGQMRRHLEQAENELEAMDAMRDGIIVPWKVKQHLGGLTCTGCEFFQPCELDDMGEDSMEFFELAYHREDPYEAHRHKKSATG